MGDWCAGDDLTQPPKPPTSSSTDVLDVAKITTDDQTNDSNALSGDAVSDVHKRNLATDQKKRKGEWKCITSQPPAHLRASSPAWGPVCEGCGDEVC